jgi:hypothetical protein
MTRRRTTRRGDHKKHGQQTVIIQMRHFWMRSDNTEEVEAGSSWKSCCFWVISKLKRIYLLTMMNMGICH